MKITMNELKKNLEKYLESDCDTGMLLLIGKDEAEQMLKVFKALDKACELIIEAVNQDCTILDEVLESSYLYRTEVREWKEWLLND